MRGGKSREKHMVGPRFTCPIYESIFVKPSGARSVGQRSATFPSPSASVDLVTFVRGSAGGSCGFCHTFPEPEAEEELAPSG